MSVCADAAGAAEVPSAVFRRASSGPAPAWSTVTALAPLMGVALGLVFLPFAWSFLAPVPLAWLFAQVARGSSRRAFVTGGLFGLGFFALHLAWLSQSLGQLFGGPGALATVPLVLLLAVTWGGLAALTRALAGPATLWALPFAWVLLEALRAWGPFAFPWGTLGYAYANTPLVQVADLGGTGLLSLLVTLSASALAARGGWARWGVAVLLVAAFAYGLARPGTVSVRTPLRAAIVQGSVDPRAKLNGLDATDLYLGLSRDALRSRRADLLLWPETATPRALPDRALQQALAELGTPAIVGALRRDATGEFNSAYAVQRGGLVGIQDKTQLVPFGERFPGREVLDPLYRRVFAGLGLPPLQGLTPGRERRVLPLGAIWAGVAICYESTFPILARRAAASGANLLVVLSNDAWFGRTAGAEQHFLMGRVRAIETRRFLLRAGNDGISAVIDPRGGVRRFPPGERAAFRASFGLASGRSLYVRLGDWPNPLSVLALGLLVSRRKSWTP